MVGEASTTNGKMDMRKMEYAFPISLSSNLSIFYFHNCFFVVYDVDEDAHFVKVLLGECSYLGHVIVFFYT